MLQCLYNMFKVRKKGTNNKPVTNLGIPVGRNQSHQGGEFQTGFCKSQGYWEGSIRTAQRYGTGMRLSRTQGWGLKCLP